MICHVVRRWCFREQCRTLIEIDADGERSRFGRFVYWQAGQKVSAYFKCGRSVYGALLNIRECEADLANDIEGYLGSGHDSDLRIVAQVLVCLFDDIRKRRAEIRPHRVFLKRDRALDLIEALAFRNPI
jgi:hypothetical protein